MIDCINASVKQVLLTSSKIQLEWKVMTPSFVYLTTKMMMEMTLNMKLMTMMMMMMSGTMKKF